MAAANCLKHGNAIEGTAAPEFEPVVNAALVEDVGALEFASVLAGFDKFKANCARPRYAFERNTGGRAFHNLVQGLASTHRVRVNRESGDATYPNLILLLGFQQLQPTHCAASHFRG